MRRQPQRPACRGRSFVRSEVAGRKAWGTTLLLLVSGSASLLAAPELDAEAAGNSGDLWRFTARFHLVLLHFPIGLLGGACLLEVYSWFRRKADIGRTQYFILLLSSLAAIVVAFMGVLLAAEGGYDPELLAKHKWLGFAVVALAIGTTLAHRHLRNSKRKLRAGLLYRGLLGATAVFLGLAGHQGGNLTHGSEYLVRYAPLFVRNLLAEAAPSGAVAFPTSASGSEFSEKVFPILLAKCVQCHGAEKQKGGYRVDDPELLFSGGDSELPAIVPGSPLESFLVRLLLLPDSDEEAMPPRGKELLTAEEILTVIHWVERGAVLPQALGVTTRESPLEEPAPSAGGAEGAVVAAVEGTGEAVVVAAVAGPGEATTVAADFQGASVDATIPVTVSSILETHCVRCHGKKKRKGKLRLHTWDDMLKGGRELGPAVVPGKPEESPLLQRVTISPDEDDDEELMPPTDDGGPLSPPEIKVLRDWLASGAPWPEGLVLGETSESRAY